ncbi:uncharacterized protein PRCAT00000795001 [Priceomyces carsonii]|uniref:uncharacterized protein n=1 Tax=Priceomyces carsonii TaxID=28549 RepID=UPI002EDA9667|nr:unnamed protein product [Priceomyces carsonii]
MNFRRREKNTHWLPIHIERDPSNDGNRHINEKESKFIFKEFFSEINCKFIITATLAILVLSILFEPIHTRWSINSCKWNKWEHWDKGSDPRRIVLIADPQLVDDNSYPGRPWIINYFAQKLSDKYLHKNFIATRDILDPDTFIFLGDLFDGGREWEDEGWFQEYHRFNSIFPKDPTRRYIQSLPGNHDIGFESINHKAYKRFQAFFGETNDYIEIGNHTIILLDTISLSSQDEWLQSRPLRFIENLSSHINPYFPRILLTHVPLYRFNDQQDCGPLRESNKKFPVMKGKQYQTVIEYDLSQKILSKINPKIVFSGDDHDYCDVTHSYKYENENSNAREITVKSSSMAGGIKYPALQLLSLNNLFDPTIAKVPQDKVTLQTEICYMPTPFLQFYVFGTTLFISIGFYAVYFLFPKLLGKLTNNYHNIIKSNDVLMQYEKLHLAPLSTTSWLHMRRRKSYMGFLSNSALLVLVTFPLFLYFLT